MIFTKLKHFVTSLFLELSFKYKNEMGKYTDSQLHSDKYTDSQLLHEDMI